MKAAQKLFLYREALAKWQALCLLHPFDLSHRNLNKPKPEDYGITDPPIKFMAAKIHDDILGGKT